MTAAKKAGPKKVAAPKKPAAKKPAAKKTAAPKKPRVNKAQSGALGGVTPSVEVQVLNDKDPVLAADLRAALKVEHRWGRLEAISPAEAMLQDVQRSQALILWIESRLEFYGGMEQAMEPSPIEGGERFWPDDYDQAEHNKRLDGDRVRKLVRWYNQERSHLTAIAKAAEASQLATRLVAVREGQARQMAAMLDAVFGDARIGLTEQQRKALPAIVREYAAAMNEAKKRQLPFNGKVIDMGDDD